MTIFRLKPLRAGTGRLVGVLLVLAALLPSARAAEVDTLRLSLAGAIRLAVDESPSAAQATLTRADGTVGLLRGVNSLLPSVSGSVGYGREYTGQVTGPDSVADGWTAGLTVNQVVFSPSVFAGMVSSAVRCAYNSTSARDQQAKLVYDVTVDYLALLKYRRLLDVAAAAHGRSGENLELARNQQRLGMLSTVDLLRAEVQEAQTRLGLLEAEQELEVATLEFKATLGLGRATVVVPTEELAEPMEYDVSDPDSLVARIQRLNPGVRMAAQSRKIAEVNQAAAIGGVLPDVSLYWQKSNTGSSLPTTLETWGSDGSERYGLQATLPLLDVKSYVLDIVDAANDSRRAAITARLASLQIHATAASAVTGYRAARERYDIACANLTLSERLHELARQQLRLGEISQVDFLDVEADLVEAQASHISAICDTYIGAAYISYLMGLAESQGS